MQASALGGMVRSLLRDLGREAVWTSFAETMDPATGMVARTALEQAVCGAFSTMVHCVTPANPTGVRTRGFVMNAGGLTGVPVPGDRLSADGTDYTVEEVQTASFKGAALVHKLLLAR